jgi:cellulose synthase/poly-beta-1,6-N-acetylglucosamine synthase-like glycosyltransferase
MISIWFFIGLLVLIYGLIILIWGLISGGHPASGRVVALVELRADLWMGSFMTLVGAFYTFHFAPWRKGEK